MDKDRVDAILWHHLAVLREAPGPLMVAWRLLSAIGVLVTAVLLFGQSPFTLPSWSWAATAGATVLWFGWGLMVANYDRYEAVVWERDNQARFVDAASSLIDERSRSEDMEDLIEAAEDLQEAILEAQDAAELQMRSDVGDWDLRAESCVEMDYEPAAVAVYTAPSHLPPVGTGWRVELASHVAERMRRLTTISRNGDGETLRKLRALRTPLAPRSPRRSRHDR